MELSDAKGKETASLLLTRSPSRLRVLLGVAGAEECRRNPETSPTNCARTKISPTRKDLTDDADILDSRYEVNASPSHGRGCNSLFFLRSLSDGSEHKLQDVTGMHF